MSDSPKEQLREYESQLADVESLLQASPSDPALLQLLSDLQELIAITRQSVIDSEPQQAILDKALEQAVGTTAESSESVAVEGVARKDDGDSKKKAKKLKEFEIPKHLIPQDNDTEAEKNKKRRAIKALKNKWRENKKEAEREMKQKSWQSFQKKKKIKDKSMFSTHEGDSKVGVVSVAGRQLTEFGERQRHKHA